MTAPGDRLVTERQKERFFLFAVSLLQQPNLGRIMLCNHETVGGTGNLVEPDRFLETDLIRVKRLKLNRLLDSGNVFRNGLTGDHS